MNLDKMEKPADIFEILKSYITQPEIPEDDEFLRIMTLHSSKGLTSKIVIVPSCIEGLIPNLKSDETSEMQEKNLKEQRRLFYVAITRYTKILVISSFSKMIRSAAYQIGAQLGGNRGKVGPTLASTFLSELGPEAPSPKNGPNWESNSFV
ncbi:MAG TPA: ATP-dependent helicase [Nitrospina sp.]|nr:ATP-dependent helicase [Nitrospina sp.]